MLETAAAIGPVFGFSLVRPLVDMDEAALLQVLEEAERAHLVVSLVAAGEASFGFAHELIRQTLLQRLSSPRRQALHLRVADALERLYAGQLPEHATDIALQLLQAGSASDAGRSIRFLALAGDRALEAVAFEDALAHFDNALALLPPEDWQGSADVRFRRELALRGLGNWEAALAAFKEALDEYARLGDATAIAHLCAELALERTWKARRW